MLYGFLGVWLALAPNGPAGATSAGPAPASGAAPAGAKVPVSQVIPFRTDAQPRVDAVFGDAAALRLAVDRFLALQTDMERVRDEFSTAVHETLAALAGNVSANVNIGPPAPAKAATTVTNGKGCPAATAAPYARALAAGSKYLSLGQQLQGRYRDIRRADDLGDAAALTPDYRVKVKHAKDLHQQLLDDYREMRVAFYDQLGAEMRHAGCKTGPGAAVAAADSPAPLAPSPSDPGAWTMDEVTAADEPAAAPASPAAAARPAAATPPAAGASRSAPAIWIDVDNTLCAQPTRVTVDGQPLGDVSAHKRTSVRTHAGPREICALPVSDARSCGDPGTVRKAYLHEGWSLTVHCEK
ncbi:MAG TPA: hypothetical protein VHK47_10375 [Polyangia bacterium]|nr:hypothetical protein [Polyangia bacterium]